MSNFACLFTSSINVARGKDYSLVLFSSIRLYIFMYVFFRHSSVYMTLLLLFILCLTLFFFRSCLLFIFIAYVSFNILASYFMFYVNKKMYIYFFI